MTPTLIYFVHRQKRIREVARGGLNPKEFLSLYGDKTYADYLAAESCASLAPALEYMYEVQGYGSITQIPALYGLMWVTPPIFQAILHGQIDGYLHLALPKIVTAWSEGWEQLWAQIVLIDGLNITYNTTVTSIVRT